MSISKFAKFEKTTQLALHLRKAGRPDSLDQGDKRILRELQNEGWSLYVNSSGEVHLGSPEGDHIKFDSGGITVYGSEKRR